MKMCGKESNDPPDDNSTTLSSIEIGPLIFPPESIAIIALAMILNIAAFLIALIYLSRRKKAGKKTSAIVWIDNVLYESETDEDEEINEAFLPKWLQEQREMIFAPSSIRQTRILGRGQYGTVYKGTLSQGKSVFPIAIKSPHMTEQEGIKLCVDEAKSMTKIGAYHDHIVNLQGVSYIYDSVEKQFSQFSLLLEYCSRGELRQYLVKHRVEFEISFKEYNETGKTKQFASIDVTGAPSDMILLYIWGFQVAEGMDFLAERHIIHGDLATRNVLLTETLGAKITDFGLSQRLYENVPQHQPLKQNDEGKSFPLAIKWMPLEVLQHQNFVPIKSDVWSFGVLTWEIFNLGKEPYRVGIDIHHLIHELVQGIRLPNPPHCPYKIGELMKKCFLENPSQRPDFKEIKDALQNACKELFQIPTLSVEPSMSDIRCSYATIMPLEKMKSDNIGKRYFEVQKSNQNKSYPTVSKQNQEMSQGTHESATSIECASSLNEDGCYSKFSVKRKINVPESSKASDDIENTPLQYARIDQTNPTAFVYRKTGITSHFTIESEVADRLQ